MVSLNENIAGVWELHPVVERSTLRRSVVNFQGTSFDSAALAIFRERLKGDVNLKPRSKDYREERVGALLVNSLLLALAE